MRPLLAIAVALTLLGSAACSNGDDADPTTTTSPSTTVALTDPTVASTEPEGTTTTAPSTTSTTAAPTTTIDPTEALIADIEADLNAGEAALMAAGADPSNVELRAELEKYFAGEVLARTQALVDGWAADGLLVRRNPDVPSILVVYSISEQDDVDSTTRARVEVCRVDAAVVYERLRDGREAIVDDGIYQSVSDVEVALVEGIWRAETGTATSEQSGLTTCDR